MTAVRGRAASLPPMSGLRRVRSSVPETRRGCLAAVLGGGFALAACLAGCAPAAIPEAAPTLSIDFRWPPLPPDTGGSSRPLSAQAPASFTIRWNPAAVTDKDVRFVAEQQCLAWNWRPRAIGAAAARDGMLARRFVCDVPLVRP